MKNLPLYNLFILCCLLLGSCSEQEASAPNIGNVTFHAVTPRGDIGDEISTLTVGEEIFIVVETQADLCTVWTGERKQAEDGTLDWSRAFADYGSPEAQESKGGGLQMNEQDSRPVFATLHTFEIAGTHELTVVATNHGFEGLDFEQATKNLSVTVGE